MQLTAYCDLDWEAFLMTCRSITGYFIHLKAVLFLFLGRVRNKQLFLGHLQKPNIELCPILLVSYYGCIIYSRTLVFPSSNLNSLYCDSQAGLHIVANLVLHERTKHTAIDYHFICEHIKSPAISTRDVKQARLAWNRTIQTWNLPGPLLTRPITVLSGFGAVMSQF